MKRITTVLIALMVVLFTQCKKDNTNSDTYSEARKVQVSCEIPISNDDKSDFTDFLTDGSIKWSAGTERIYLAVHHEDASKAQIVELTANPTQTATLLAFKGEVDEDILTDGETYEVWYLGNSMNIENPYVTITETDGVITKIDGSIANQSGRLEDLGYHHIAKAEVTARLEADRSYTLPLHGTLQNYIAIAYMNLSMYTYADNNVLKGDAIIGTNYSLRYSDGEYKFVVNGGDAISVPISSNAFVVFFPNENNNNLRLKCFPSSVFGDYKTYYYIYKFNEGIITNNVYCSLNDNSEIEPLALEKIYPFNGHEYIDLNLPSGTLWAKYNVGVDPNNLTTAEDYHGELYLWGSTTVGGAAYNGELNDIQGTDYDVARVKWQGDWMIPTYDQMRELINWSNLEWTWISNYQGKVGLNGFSVHPVSSNPPYPSKHIFLPLVPAITSPQGIPEMSIYWNSRKGKGLMILDYNTQFYAEIDWSRDGSVRPVIKKWW